MNLPSVDELVGLRGAAHGLSLRCRRSAMAQLFGGHHSTHRGRGLEFEEVRPYVSGDDMRNIDWRVTARRGRPHTKLFREERERPVWLLADLHPGLYFGSRRQFKSALLVRTAALLAWSAALGGDRIGAVWVNNTGHRILVPRMREAGVLPVLQALDEMQPRAPGTPFALFDFALEKLLPLVHPGSLVLVLSDFSGLTPRSLPALAGLCAHNECRLLWVADELESKGLPSGRFRAGFPGQLRTLDGDRVRETWQASWRERESQILELARQLFVPLTRLDTSMVVEEALPPLLREPVWEI